MPNRVDMYSEEGVTAWHNSEVHPEGFIEMASFFKDAEAYPFALNDKAAVNDIVTEELDRFFYGNQTVEDTLANIEERGNTELAR
jgi:multiple sugar transport system substrate-binding protein